MGKPHSPQGIVGVFRSALEIMSRDAPVPDDDARVLDRSIGKEKFRADDLRVVRV